MGCCASELKSDDKKQSVNKSTNQELPLNADINEKKTNKSKSTFPDITKIMKTAYNSKVTATILLVGGYIRIVELLLNGQIIPSSINELCLKFYVLKSEMLAEKKAETRIYRAERRINLLSMKKVIELCEVRSQLRAFRLAEIMEIGALEEKPLRNCVF